MARRRPRIEQAVKDLSNKRYLIAVSGGLDSVCLLHALYQHPGLQSLAVAHVDHGLRHDSEQDAAFVADLASRYSLQCYSTRLSPPKMGENIEAWARDSRYAFLYQVLEAQKYDAVVTAHHANDVAETLLMRMLFNRPFNTIEPVSRKNTLYRPLLQVPGEDFHRYAEEFQLKYREDSSNRDTRFLRNKIRHELIPYLEESLEKSVVSSLCDRAFALQEDYEALHEVLEPQLKSVREVEFGSKLWKHLLIEFLELAPTALQWRAIESLLLERLGYKLGRRSSLKVCDFLLRTRTQVELPNAFLLRHRNGGIELLKRR